MFYRRLVRPLLYLLPAEAAHRLAFAVLRWLLAAPGLQGLVRRATQANDERLRTDVFGRVLTNPVGLAAGFDKDAVGIDALGALGFGFVEVGTLTGLPQPGNPKPRMFRLVKDRALVNRLGFNNRGSQVAAERLRRPRQTNVGVNIGKSKVTAEADAVSDYVASAARVAAGADYVVVNVSSPNTPGLRDLQATEKLGPILAAVREALDRESERRVPLLVKIAPDLSDDDIDAVADLALRAGLDGIVATNTTIARSDLASSSARVESCGAGGLSGAPLRRRSLAVLRRIRRRVGDRLILVSVGGIEDAAGAWERIRAGATLIQLYTGFVYGGPAVPSRIARGLAELASTAGFARVQDAVGVEVEPEPQSPCLEAKEAEASGS